MKLGQRLSHFLITLVAVASLFSATCDRAFAQSVPSYWPYQGFLSDASGAPVNGAASITVSVYAEASSVTPLWTDTFVSVPVTNGAFSIDLGERGGENFKAIINSGEARYLGVTVDDGPELTPRSRIASLPYATVAANALQFAGRSADDFVTTEALQTAVEGVVDHSEEIAELRGLIQTAQATATGAQETATGAQEIADGNREQLQTLSTSLDDLTDEVAAVRAIAEGALTEGEARTLIESYGYLTAAQIANQITVAIDARGYVTLQRATELATEAAATAVAALRTELSGQITALTQRVQTLEGSQGVQDGKITALETSQGVQDDKIIALEDSQDVQDGKITALETSQGVQNGKISTLESSQGVQDGKITALETSQGVQNGKISTLENSQGVQDGKITALETSQGVQNGKITALETSQGVQDGKISTLETSQGVQDGKITALETSQGVQDGKITALETTTAGGSASAPTILGVTNSSTTGKIAFDNGGGIFEGLRGAGEMCKSTFSAEPTAHVCSLGEIQGALSVGNFPSLIDGVETWVLPSYTRPGSFVGDAMFCQTGLYNSGHAAVGISMTILKDATSTSGGTGIRYSFNEAKACNSSLRIMCCK